jgi:flagellar biosynthetic protein FlhB
MVDQADRDQKTERPTEHALKKARERGQVAQSKELYHTLVLLSLLFFIGFAAQSRGSQFLLSVRLMMDSAAERPLDAFACMQTVRSLLLQGASVVIPLIVMLVLFVVAGLGAQTRFRVSHQLFKDPLSKVSVQKGLQRIFSRQHVLEFLKNVAKVVVLVGFASMMIVQHSSLLLSVSGADVRTFFSAGSVLVVRLLTWVVVGVFVLSVLDYGHQWFSMFRNLFMSKLEVKQEYKEHEGDPHVVAQRRRVQKEIAHMRHAAKQMDDATVVITNPEHYAVVLQWVAYRMMAPTVLCKGQGRLALYIKRLAAERGVPVMENPPLAQSLYRFVKVGGEIPPEHYKAVANIIHYVMTRNKRTQH